MVGKPGTTINEGTAGGAFGGAGGLRD